MSLQIVYDGLVRRVEIIFSVDWDLFAPVALVIALPDSHQRVGQLFSDTGKLGLPPGIDDTVWPGERAITIIPEGVALRTDEEPALAPDRLPAWSALYRDGEGLVAHEIDIDFLRWLVDWVAERFQEEYNRLHPQDFRNAVDVERVYVLGVGTGGVLAYSLGWLLPRIGWPVQALAVYGGSIGGKRQASEDGELPGRPFPGTGPVSVLAIHGMNDARFVPENNLVIPGVGALPYYGAISQAVVDDLVAAGVPLVDAEQIAPWDVVLRKSVLDWVGLFPPPVNAQITSVQRGSATLDVTYWTASGGTLVTAEVTFPGIHELPDTWDVAQVVWDFFANPASVTV